MPLISKHIIRKIESELYSYPTTADQMNDIMYGTSYPEVMVSGGEMGNTTQSKALRLTQIESDWVKLIQQALKTIPMEYSLLIRYKYFEHKSNDMTAESLHISRALYYAWKENAILCLALLASQRGLINPMENREIG